MAKWRERKQPKDDSDHKQLLAVVQEIKKDNKNEYDRMDRSLKLYEGKLWNLSDNEFMLRDRPEGRSDVQFNTIFANVEQTAPMVTASRPITKVVPRFPYMERMGVVLNHVLKYLWEALDIQMLLYKAVKDQMVFGTAIFKVGYNPDKPGGGNVEISLIDPRHFAIAPGYDTIWDAPFVFHWEKKPLSWVHRQFPGVKEIEPDAGSEETGAYKFGDISEVQSHTKFVTVYEMWTRDDQAYEEVVTQEGEEPKKEKRQKYPYGKICFFTEGQMLGIEACGDEHGLPPYVELHDYIRPHNFLGMSEVHQTEGLHKEINALLKYISEYVRKYHDPNFLVDISQLSDESYQAVLDKMSEGGQYIPWDSTGEKSPPIIQINEGELNDLIIPYMTFLMEIIDIISGVTDVNRGMVGKKERQSASELAMLKEASDTRTMQRVRNLEWTLRRLFKIVLSLVQQYYNEPRSLSYADGGGRRYVNYGNSFAQAQDIMAPQPMNEEAQYAQQKGMPMVGENEKEAQRYERERADFEKFMQFFTDDEGNLPGDYDPIAFDFDIEIQSDSTLPTDKQSRANLFLRLRQLKALDIQSLLESLQISDVEEKVKRIKEEMGGGNEEMMQKLMQNPQAVQQLKARAAQGGQQ